jgi:hypothetical protein
VISHVVRLVALLVLAVHPATAQAPAPVLRDTAPSRTLEVYHVAIGEGQYYWEKFGHNALWFRDPARGLDLAYNWGTFDFAEPGFLGKVLLANQRYWVDAVPAPLLLDYYRQSDRSLVVQRLNLTPEQATRALRFAEWNALEANKYYRYDYFRDNCSTRVRDVIDLAVGGALKRATTSRATDLTYREESLRLVDDMKLTQFGIDAALGAPSDTRLSAWQAMFVPSRVRETLRDVRVPDSAGALVPLVAEERVVYESRSHQERQDAPDLRWVYLLTGCIIAALIVLPARLGERSRGWDRAFRAEASVWASLTGVLGLVILLAWLITQHVFWFRNENLLLLNPLALFLAALAPLASRDRWRRPAAVLAIVLALLAALALILKGLPWFAQDNLALILLVLPAQFALAWGLWRRAGGRLPAA